MKITYSKQMGSNASNIYFVPFSDLPNAIACVFYSEKEWMYEIYHIPEMNQIFSYTSPANCRLRFFSDSIDLLALFYNTDDVTLNRIAKIHNDGTLEDMLSIPEGTRAIVFQDKLYLLWKTDEQVVSFFDKEGNIQFSVPQKYFDEYDNCNAHLEFDGHFVYVLFQERIYIFNKEGKELESLDMPVPILPAISRYIPHILKTNDSLSIYGMSPSFTYFECVYIEKEWSVREIFTPPLPIFDVYRCAEQDGSVLLHGTTDVDEEDKRTTFCYFFKANHPTQVQTMFAKKRSVRYDNTLGEVVWINDHQFIFWTPSAKKTDLHLYSISSDANKPKHKVNKLSLPGFVMDSCDVVCAQEKVYILVRHFGTGQDPTTFELVAIEISQE